MEAHPPTRVIRRGGGDVRVVRTCVVEVLSGPDAGLRRTLDRPTFRVGTHEANDLVLSDETVSAHHLEITVEPEGFRVVDLGSSNSTFAGSAKVGELTIVDTTVLKLGKTMLRLQPTPDEVEVPTSTRTQFGKVLGVSVPMRELFAQLEAVARSECSVLVEGETGVGKEVVAQSIHDASARGEGPFLVVDCSALAGELIEAELFGHAKGAYTGADREREGLLEAANGGTLFLDEIGELPLKLQAKLLGALERRQVRRVGESVPRSIDVRVMAATHRNLAREVNEKRFRADLFFRISVVRLRVPPLRDRLDDLPLLANGMLDELRPRYGDDLPETLSALALARLAAQPWPGNVRELRNAVERVALQIQPQTDPAESTGYIGARDAFLDQFDRRYFGELLARYDQDLGRAAHAVGLTRAYLQRLLRKAGVSRQSTAKSQLIG